MSDSRAEAVIPKPVGTPAARCRLDTVEPATAPHQSARVPTHGKKIAVRKMPILRVAESPRKIQDSSHQSAAEAAHVTCGHCNHDSPHNGDPTACLDQGGIAGLAVAPAVNVDDGGGRERVDAGRQAGHGRRQDGCEHQTQDTGRHRAEIEKRQQHIWIPLHQAGQHGVRKEAVISKENDADGVEHERKRQVHQKRNQHAVLALTQGMRRQVALDGQLVDAEIAQPEEESPQKRSPERPFVQLRRKSNN